MVDVLDAQYLRYYKAATREALHILVNLRSEASVKNGTLFVTVAGSHSDDPDIQAVSTSLTNDVELSFMLGSKRQA